MQGNYDYGYRQLWRDTKSLINERKKVIPYGFRHPREWDYADWGCATLRSLSAFIMLLMP